MKILHTPLSAALLATVLVSAVAPAHAQQAEQPTTDSAVVVDDDRNERDDDFDWGLLGLLGLLGLIPRKRKDVVVHHDNANRNTTTSNDPNRR